MKKGKRPRIKDIIADLKKENSFLREAAERVRERQELMDKKDLVIKSLYDHIKILNNDIDVLKAKVADLEEKNR